ncbi:MAG: hypothetical protein EXQ93_06665 [Alphaproteobacteria bacterium]|nr:hypothetical protein [Alphaproteobacteria bacterium]
MTDDKRIRPPVSGLSVTELRNSAKNHERGKATQTPRYRDLVEELARRQGKKLTCGDLASASGVAWTQARRLMDGAHGHLDNFLSVCNSLAIPLLTALCVNKEELSRGELSEGALSGFVKGAQRLGYSVADGRGFLKECQAACFAWGRAQR